MTVPRSLRSSAVTFALWMYFIGGFLGGYWIVFVFAWLLRRRRGIAWGLATYLRGFFAVLRLAIPRTTFRLPERSLLRGLRGSVVVCNHVSFLDPLLLMACIPTVITIVRPDFFRIPIFGWLLRGAGFLGPDLFSQGQEWIGKVDTHLRSGGNLVIFPEGTRSRDGTLAPFKKGAFYLAKHLAAPIVVLAVDGTGKLFAPGSSRFDPQPGQVVSLAVLATISADDAANATTHELASRVRALYEPPAPAHFLR